MNRWFMSDPHFGSEKIIRGMGRVDPRTNKLFTNADAFDDYLIAQLNAQVMREDELYCLGDWSRATPGKYRARINCRHIKLILGNHDQRGKCERVFGTCPDTMKTKLRYGSAHLNCILSHYPTCYWDRSHHGWAHLYGHCHGQREGSLDTCFPGRRSMDITVDNIYNLVGDYRPLSEAFLYRYFIQRPGHDDVAHYDNIKAKRDKRLGLT